MTTGSFKKSTIWLIGLQIYSLLLSLIIGPLTVRALGPQLHGDMMYAESIIVIFYTFAQFGLGGIVVAELVQHPEKEEETIGTVMVIRIVMSVIAMLLSAVTALILKPQNKMILLSTYIQTTAILFLSYEAINYWFQGKLLNHHFSIISAIGLTLEDLFKVYLIMKDPDMLKFSIANTIRYAFIFICLLILFYKLNPGFKMKFNLSLAKKLLRRGFHFFIASVGTMIYYKIDSLMVGSMIDSISLSFYTVGLNISDMWQMIPNSISTTAQPVIARYKGNDEKKYIETYQLLLLGITCLCVIACIGALLIGKPVILFLYGEPYRNSVLIFHIIIFASIFSSLSMARSNWIVCEKYENQSKYFVFIGAVIDIVLNYIFIKMYGVVGAALSTFVTEFAVFFFVPYLFKETRRSNEIYFGCFKQFPNLIAYVKQTLHQIFNRLKKA